MDSYKYTDNLESERLITRFLTEHDKKEWVRFLGDEACIQYFPKYPHSLEQRAIDWIDAQLERYKTDRFGLQAIIEKNSNTMLGQCGLLMQLVNGKAEIEVGYHFYRSFWGKGFAPEAAKLFMDYAFTNQLTNSIISLIHPQNIKSQRVAIKNGLKKDGKTMKFDTEFDIYRMSRL
jgi:ribosomal-protein-alanine N-acetyltransferase